MADPLSHLSAALAGSYAIDRELGSGGMATVYLAQDLKHGRQVAIKVLRPDLATALGPDRFVREIEIAANLTHPHILPLFDSGTADGFVYYVMPFVDGESLRDRLRREGRLSIEEAIRFAEQVASALTYAHDRGVVHRDIKPENILLAGGQATVVDFGIARAVTAAGGERLTVTGLAIGTPAYMSPEQAFGAGEVDGRTDTYALGCVVYEMISGRAPFEGSTAQALLAMHAAKTVPRLRATDRSVPLFVERAVQRAMAKVPADRFATAEAFAEALSTGTVVARVRRRRATSRTLVAAGVLAMLAAGWAVERALGGGPDLGSLAVLPLENLTGDSAEAYVGAGMHEALIAELARIQELRVISRRSVMRYAGTEKSVPEIARELNVDGVVTASFGRTGENVRVSVRLLDARSEEGSLWQQVYVRDIGDVLAMYGEVAAAIAGEIGIRIDPRHEARLATRRRMNRDAYEAYLRGRFAITQGDPVAVQQGLAYLHEANARDPADPLPYVGLAIGYGILGHGPRPEVLPRAVAAAERALALDSMLAEPYAVLAQAKLYREWDWAGAERAFRRALELNSTLADARAHYAWYFDLLGPRDRALDEMQRAIASDPLDPLWPTWLASLYMDRGLYGDAIEAARHAIEVNPTFGLGVGMLGRALAEAGMRDSALAVLESVEGDPAVKGMLAQVYAKVGRIDDARRIAIDMEATAPVGLKVWQLPQIYAALGDTERALYWLEQAFVLPHPYAPWLVPRDEHAPWFATMGSLREEPRYQALLQRLNLPGGTGG